MKHRSLTFGLILVVAAFFTEALKSCSGKDSFANSERTCQIVGRSPQNLLFIDSALVRITKKRKLDADSNSLNASFRIDTAVYLLQFVDTLRDSLRHPMFDANHNVRMLTRYSPMPVDDSLLQFLRIIDIPERGVKK